MMTVPRRLAAALRRLLAPWRSARMGLTALYAAFFVVCAAGLLVLVLGLGVHGSEAVAFSHSGGVACAVPSGTPAGETPCAPCVAAASGVSAGAAAPCGGGARGASAGPGRGGRVGAAGGQAPVASVEQHVVAVRHLLVDSGIALGAMSVAAVGLGWVMSDRVLRPIRAMAAATRRISADSLHARLAMQGPRDEVTDLADTIDGLLGRLETAFAAQRRFIANAAHELSTPLTLDRALLEVALAEPGASADSLKATCLDLLASNEDQARLIEALLALATGERGLDRRDPVDLAAVARRVLGARQAEADRQGLDVRAAIAPAVAAGNTDLVERLVANLVDNAVRHNAPGGWVEVKTAEAAGRPLVAVRNSGPVIPDDQIDRLFEPFQRLGAGRGGGAGGHGLGLSIVRAIARAHGAEIAAHPRPEGGLDVEVRFPAGGGHGAPPAPGGP